MIEYDSIADFPNTGEPNKIYVSIEENLTYRWTGSSYVEISASIALGETSSTAYRGDRGKIAYEHSQSANGVTAGTYRSVTVNAQGHVISGSNPTTLAGYGITDAATKTHTHLYAGASSEGGSATSAVKLDTSTAGSATQPVYFTGGKPSACTYTLGKSVPSNAEFTDVKVNISTHSPTSQFTYYPTMHTSYETTAGLYTNTSIKYESLLGTPSVGNTGFAKLVLGNSVASGTLNNTSGRVILYSSDTSYHELTTTPTSSAIEHTLPATSGTILNSGTTSFTQSLTSGTKIGSIKINGTSTDLYAPSNSDTKNTAGSTNSSSKLYLIGATSQAANPQTYSHDTCYVGTDGCLYSDGKQVVNLSGTQALTNKTYNGYTLAAACAKGVDTSVTSSSENLITSGAVHTELNKKISFSGGTSLKSGDDLNDYTTPGIYIVGSSSIASGIVNGPLKGSGYKVTVIDGYISGRVTQFVTTNSNSLYYRQNNGSSWLDWAKLYTTSDIPSLTDLGITATASELNYVDGVTSAIQTQLNAKAKGSSITGKTAATEGWYRIATSVASINRNIGIFEIEATIAGKHTTAIISASSLYGKADSSFINILHCSHFTASAITKARIVYHTSYDSKYAYLEIYSPNAVALSVTVKLIGGTGWSLVTPSTEGNIPDGYSNKEITLSNNTIVAGTFKGNLSGNAETSTKATSVDIGEGSTDVERNIVVCNPESASQNMYLVSGVTANYKKGTLTASGGFVGNLIGNANSATKLGSSTVGGASKPIYLSSGTPTACSSTIGSVTQPVYMNSGTITKCTYTLGKSVPSDAVFTDTNVKQTTSSTSNYRVLLMGTSHSSTLSDLEEEETGQVYKNTNIVACPNTGEIKATKFTGNLNGTASKATQDSAGQQINTTYIKALSSSGTTITYTKGDNTIGTISTKDTTYSNFVKSGSGAAAGLVPAPSTTAGTTKYLREDGTWAVPPDTNTKVTISANAPTSDTKYYPTMHTSTSGTTVVTSNADFRVNILTGTTTTVGHRKLVLGNTTASGTDGNAAGELILYSENKSYHKFLTTPTSSAIEHTLPATSGTILNSGTTSFTQSLTSGTKIGSIKINGTSTDLYAPSNSDTKNTAGSTNSSSKLYLIGATSQAANPQTYSHDTCYVGTDGCLYSDGMKVSVEGHTHTSATNATKLTTTSTTGETSLTTYNLPFTSATSTGANAYNFDGNSAIQVAALKGTTSVDGQAALILGNSTASGTNNNKFGFVRLYGTGKYYTDINSGTPTANRTITLPDKSGTVALTTDIPSGASITFTQLYSDSTLAIRNCGKMFIAQCHGCTFNMLYTQLPENR